MSIFRRIQSDTINSLLPSSLSFRFPSSGFLIFCYIHRVAQLHQFDSQRLFLLDQLLWNFIPLPDFTSAQTFAMCSFFSSAVLLYQLSCHTQDFKYSAVFKNYFFQIFLLFVTPLTNHSLPQRNSGLANTFTSPKFSFHG